MKMNNLPLAEIQEFSNLLRILSEILKVQNILALLGGVTGLVEMSFKAQFIVDFISDENGELTKNEIGFRTRREKKKKILLRKSY